MGPWPGYWTSTSAFSAPRWTIPSRVLLTRNHDELLVNELELLKRGTRVFRWSASTVTSLKRYPLVSTKTKQQ
jgi:hypothetical protein